METIGVPGIITGLVLIVVGIILFKVDKKGLGLGVIIGGLAVTVGAVVSLFG